MCTISRAASPMTNLGELSERIAAAASATGIGLTLLPVAYAQGGVDGRALAGGQLRFGNDFDRYVELAQLLKRLQEMSALTQVSVSPRTRSAP